MIGLEPKFLSSPYFVGERFNWHLKPGAPKDIVDEFNAYMEALNSMYGKSSGVEEVEEV